MECADNPRSSFASVSRAVDHLDSNRRLSLLTPLARGFVWPRGGVSFGLSLAPAGRAPRVYYAAGLGSHVGGAAKLAKYLSALLAQAYGKQADECADRPEGKGEDMGEDRGKDQGQGKGKGQGMGKGKDEGEGEGKGQRKDKRKGKRRVQVLEPYSYVLDVGSSFSGVFLVFMVRE